ncbi:hypothetical protein LP52_15940 [Streptomonospora alba]|uniref:DUF1440 domain-containing protein n=1 Tax=Streptomonospora alba TaxID=183763 RepID=A0A0C2J935_9ACTN|nr:hypothetical protein [Streptomonospora alba]KIH98006.1 hypothetical protein LP52_15940 [Streptomonospora alba]
MLIRPALQGAVAGALATGAMTTVFEAGSRQASHRHPPKHMVRAHLPGRGRSEKPRTGENAATGAAHLGFGIATGALFGTVTGRRRPARSLGVAYALAVMFVGYQGWAPKVGALPPLTQDSPGRTTTLAAAHVVYGWTLASTLRRMRRP